MHAECVDPTHPVCQREDGFHLSRRTARIGVQVGRLNAGDVIVGQGRDGDHQSCLMYAQGTLVDLQNVLYNPGSWVLSDCDDINDAGVIVGNGVIGGQQHALMLTPD